MWRSRGKHGIAGALFLCVLAAGCSEGPEQARAEDGGSSQAAAPAAASIDRRGPGYRVVNRFPHDDGAYTQGLAFHKGRFYEGTGLEGQSSLRLVKLRTGEVLRKVDLDDEYFGEGVTLIGDQVFQITWQEETAFVYDVATFERLKTFDYNNDDTRVEEGWGLADDGSILAMSDGSEVIRFRDPETFEVVREITVTENGTPVFYLNELEWIGDEIFANVFGYDHVVRIDPETGIVVGRFDLAKLRAREQDKCPHEPEVTNGIAYLQSKDRFFVTGKNWCHLYEIELNDPPGAP
jgi:glutaminyl-peptide cyclotransferase